MSNSYTIALDAMGGDFGPSVVIPAAAMALRVNGNLRFLIYGDEKQILPLLNAETALKAVSTIRHTDKVVASDEKPSLALRNGRDSSMRLAIDAVKNGEAQGIVSAGNTGALMAMAKVSLKCLPGVTRPAIASVFPTRHGETVVLDLGANVVCDAEVLVQFAVLGAVYARVVKGIEKPTLGLLNVGSEDIKGHDDVRAAHAILSKMDFPAEYQGFVEGDDIPMGTVNVVVTDGFTGNVALKVGEGVGSLMNQFLKDELKSTLKARIGAFLAMGALKRLKRRMDPRHYNGGMFLGLNGICVKSHGGMDSYGFSRAIAMAASLVENGFNTRVCQEIELLMSQDAFVASLVTEAEGVAT